MVIEPHRLSDVLVAKVRFGELAIQNALEENQSRLFPALAGHWDVSDRRPARLPACRPELVRRCTARQLGRRALPCLQARSAAVVEARPGRRTSAAPHAARRPLVGPRPPLSRR